MSGPTRPNLKVRWCPASIARPPMAGIPLEPTETILCWAAEGGTNLDRRHASNTAIVYYGHKEKPEKARHVKPKKAPRLVLSRTVKDCSDEGPVLTYDDPPPETLIYRLKIANVGSADYRGKLEVVDELPDEVEYLGFKKVRDRKRVYLPYIGPVEAKSKVERWHVEPESGGKGTRVRWWIDDAELEKGHWIMIDIEFEPPPFEVSAPAQ